jgi:hypothetical protein
MEVIGYSTRELIDAMGDAGIHCSLDRFKRLAIALQSAALAQFVAGDGPAVEIRVINNPEELAQ